MRELKLDVPKRGGLVAVRRLRFVAGGAELVAWVGEPGFGGDTVALYTLNTATGATGPFDGGNWDGTEPAVSPDGRFLIFEDHYHDSTVWFEDRTHRIEDGFYLPSVRGPWGGLGEIVFSPDGAEFWAVRHLARQDRGWFARDLARFPLALYRNPPTGYEQKINPLNGRTYQAPIHDEKLLAATWSAGVPLPPGRFAHSAALSADGRLFAFGDAGGAVVVVELEGGAAVATVRRAWPASVKGAERVARRVAFGPGAERVVSLANGRLFADPLGSAKAWKTAPDLPAVNDFAAHPTGQFLCAACADGRARYLDPATGAVTRTFKWAKKPKPLDAVCFAPDGLTCAAGAAGGKVIVWDVDF